MVPPARFERGTPTAADLIALITAETKNIDKIVASEWQLLMHRRGSRASDTVDGGSQLPGPSHSKYAQRSILTAQTCQRATRRQISLHDSTRAH